jgi:hypothetical protein
MVNFEKLDLTDTEKDIYRVILTEGPLTFSSLMKNSGIDRDSLIDIIDCLDNGDLIKKSEKQIKVDRAAYGRSSIKKFCYEALNNDEINFRKNFIFYMQDQDANIFVASIQSSNLKITDNFDIVNILTLTAKASSPFSLDFYFKLVDFIWDCNQGIHKKINISDLKNLAKNLLSHHNSRTLKYLKKLILLFPEILENLAINELQLIDLITDIAVYENTIVSEYLKKIIDENNMMNALIIFALFSGQRDNERIELKDILDLLKQIINKSTNLRSEDKGAIDNLIFPICVCTDGHSRFEIMEDFQKFCEGKYLTRNGESYVMCRNHQCNELTGEKGKFSNASGSIFIEILKKHFGISYEDILPNREFILGMGALNRWNEIRGRLICGFGDTEGCSSPLEYSSTAPGGTGWAAYATTFWICSNESCKICKNAELIKLSHCKGCGKIIDSRFDHQQCPRDDDNIFYICKKCGYCCQQHGVSGLCPVCGEDKGWNNADQNNSYYRCKNCNHTIKIPKKIMGNNLDENKFPKCR